VTSIQQAQTEHQRAEYGTEEHQVDRPDQPNQNRSDITSMAKQRPELLDRVKYRSSYCMHKPFSGLFPVKIMTASLNVCNLAPHRRRDRPQGTNSINGTNVAQPVAAIRKIS
jgi:hypothetical protein